MVRPVLGFGVLLAVLGALLGVAGWEPFGRQSAPREEPRDGIEVAAALRELVRSEVTRHSQELRICFTDAVELGVDSDILPEFAGRFPLSFGLDPKDGVHDVVIAERRGTATDACVQKRLQQMRLPQLYGRDLVVSLDVEVILDGRASITAEAPTVNGPLDPAVVGAVVEAHRRELAQCYVDRSLLDAALQGTLDLDLTIDPQGQVQAVTVRDSTVDDQELIFCAAASIWKWVFPAVGGRHNTSVRSSFNFTPTGW